MNLCELRPAKAPKIKNGEEAEVMQPVTVKQQAEVTKVKVSVPVPAANAASRAVRCLCIEDSQKEASLAETAKTLLQSM